MRGVDIHVSAAICAEHLDRDLRGDRALSDRLRVDFLIDHHRGVLIHHDWFALRIDNGRILFICLLHLVQ